ncbi:MAG: hypothetical protein IJO05_06715 [Oscillospiraceae bacterium]|nr:hypothetical protein [Oscillospiraceae bacterium]
MKQELVDMIDACSAEIDDIRNRLSTLPVMDRSRRYLTQYALIRACGTIEFVYRSIVADFFDSSPLTQIHTYLEKTVRTGSMSATYKNMQTLLGKFDDNWKSNFQQAVNSHADSNRIIASAKSLVENRHAFAHGRTPTATFNDIQNYYNDALTLIDLFDSIVV